MPFSNLTFDIKVPEILKDEPVIIGGKYTNDKYGDFQAEMDMFNKAFCESCWKVTQKAGCLLFLFLL